jgi:hypothetical protein
MFFKSKIHILKLKIISAPISIKYIWLFNSHSEIYISKYKIENLKIINPSHKVNFGVLYIVVH